MRYVAETWKFEGLRVSFPVLNASKKWIKDLPSPILFCFLSLNIFASMVAASQPTNRLLVHVCLRIKDCIDTKTLSLARDTLRKQAQIIPASKFCVLEPSTMLILDFVRKTFYVSGYTLLYLVAMFAAGGVGRIAAFVAEKWILKRFMRKQLEANRNFVEVSRELCVLTCSTGFLIVAVGLLFMHLANGLPHEYDELAVQVAIAFFGLLVFICFCLSALLIVVSGLWALGRLRSLRSRVTDDDEEAGLFKNSSAPVYGTSEDLENDEDGEDSQRRDSERTIKRLTEPAPPHQVWINMDLLSSVRNLDFGLMRGSQR